MCISLSMTRPRWQSCSRTSSVGRSIIAEVRVFPVDSLLLSHETWDISRCGCIVLFSLISFWASCAWFSRVRSRERRTPSTSTGSHCFTRLAFSWNRVIFSSILCRSSTIVLVAIKMRISPLGSFLAATALTSPESFARWSSCPG